MVRNKPVTVGNLLSVFLKESGLEKGYREYQLLKLWNEMLGGNVSKATLSKRIENKKLYVHLSSSVVRDELYMMRSDIIREFNRRAGANIIEELILK
ncbi:MAG: DUF721 domain-containing protein [Prevotellaceae bacterium]|jgi:hypothetical protein|nr:DUF721 domain-containing protein [Prevotellaceae bacterium]